jgi:predicted glutamine amidotransferase
VNADGFGVGWYADGDLVPARYRRAGPIWADECFADLARVTRTSAMLGAVRSATAGTDTSASAAAPYAHGRWLFSHNGALTGWSSATAGVVASPDTAAGSILGDARPGNAGPGHARSGDAGASQAGPNQAGPNQAGPNQTGANQTGPNQTGPNQAGADTGASQAIVAVHRLAAGLPAADLLGLAAHCDSALIWAIVLGRLRSGAGLAEALDGTLGDLASAGVAGRFNLLLTDGEAIAATAAGDSLCFRRDPAGVTVASEPYDNDTGWQDVPDGSVVEATPQQVIIRSLTAPVRYSGNSMTGDSVAGTPNAGEFIAPGPDKGDSTAA